MESGNSVQTFRDNISLTSSRVKRSWPSKLGPTGCSVTLAQNYHCTLRNIVEEHRCHGNEPADFTKCEEFFLTGWGINSWSTSLIYAVSIVITKSVCTIQELSNLPALCHLSIICWIYSIGHRTTTTQTPFCNWNWSLDCHGHCAYLCQREELFLGRQPCHDRIDCPRTHHYIYSVRAMI
jgi:hypothetical protein